MAWTVSGFTWISAIHQPLYRGEAHTSTITAEARGGLEKSGIRRITLTVTTGEMTDCTELGGVPSVIPCRKNATVVQQVCHYPDSPIEAKCQYQLELVDNRIVTYVVEAEDGLGSVVVIPKSLMQAELLQP
jgi:hypothetical protein